MPVITPPTTSQCCTRGCSSSHPLGGRFIFQPRSFKLPALAALCSFSFALRRQVHPTSPNNFNFIPSHNPDSCWRRNPTRSRFLTTHLHSLRCFGAWLRHMGVSWPCFRIASLLSWLGFVAVPRRSSSAIDRGSSFIRFRSLIRTPRIRWRFGVGAAASSLWLFWVPPTHRRDLVTSAGRSPFICCASTAGNADSRATSRIVRHRKDQVHPSFWIHTSMYRLSSHFYLISPQFIPFGLFPHHLGDPFRRAVISRAAWSSVAPKLLFGDEIQNKSLSRMVKALSPSPRKPAALAFYRVFLGFGSFGRGNLSWGGCSSFGFSAFTQFFQKWATS